MRHEFMVGHDEVRSLWSPPTFRFSPRGPRFARSWLEQFARFVMRWTRCEVEQVVRTRTFQVARGDTLLQRMNLSQNDMRRLYDQRARYLFCGPEVVGELLRETCVMPLGPLDARIGSEGKIIVCGVEVVMVPWMTGTLLVPDWKEAPRG